MSTVDNVEQKRSAVIQLWKNGHRQADIWKSLGTREYTRSFVSRTINRYNKLGTLKDAPRSGRPRSVRTPVVRRKIRQMLSRKPTLSYRRIAARACISNTSAQRVISNDIGVKSFRRTRTEALNQLTIKKRVQRCRKLSASLKNVDLDNIVFSDEKLWSIEEKHNTQNSRVYAISRDNIPEQYKRVEKSLHPKTVMVWAGISGRGKIPIVFLPEGAKINAILYQELVLSKHVSRIGNTFMKGNHWLFQQDGAPAHTAASTQDWLANNVPDFIGKNDWPPSSPDINPCDFYLWGRMEAIVNSRSYDSIESLKRAIRRTWDQLDQEEVANVCRKFPEKLKKCIQTKGKRFE